MVSPPHHGYCSSTGRRPPHLGTPLPPLPYQITAPAQAYQIWLEPFDAGFRQQISFCLLGPSDLLPKIFLSLMGCLPSQCHCSCIQSACSASLPLFDYRDNSNVHCGYYLGLSRVKDSNTASWSTFAIRIAAFALDYPSASNASTCRTRATWLICRQQVRQHGFVASRQERFSWSPCQPSVERSS